MSGSDPRPLAAARHYLRRGAALGLHPHPLFAPEHVVAASPALGEGVDPLVSYLESQAFEVPTHPLFDVAAYLAMTLPPARTRVGRWRTTWRSVRARGWLPTPGTDPTRTSRRDSSTGSSPVSANAPSVRRRHPRPWTRQQPRGPVRRRTPARRPASAW